MDLRTALDNIKPHQMASEIMPVHGYHNLFETEIYCIPNAVAKRKNEFAAGRAAARAALNKLGVPSQPILRAKDRRPVWPEGIVGSISHAEGLAGAVVGYSLDMVGVGLDIEASAPLKKELLKHILTQNEYEQREAEPIVNKSPRCKVSFVAKEALFKAVYPITRKFFGFQDAQVDIKSDGSWSAIMINTASGLPINLAICEGKWTATDSMIVATVCIKGAK